MRLGRRTPAGADTPDTSAPQNTPGTQDTPGDAPGPGDPAPVVADPERPDEEAVWGTPTFPEQIRDEQRLVVVEDAVASRFRMGRLRTFVEPNRWMFGAIYDERRRLVVESQRIGGLRGNNLLAADPPRLIGSAEGAEPLAGTWLYGGHWINHFGHFVLETVPTLWPTPEELRAEHGPIAGLVFHKYLGDLADPFPWQHELLSLTGWGDLPTRVVDKQPLRIERLVVPSRPVIVNGWAHAGAPALWDRMARAAGVGAHPDTGTAADPHRLSQRGREHRVFFSRTAFNAERRISAKAERVRSSAETDEALDALFAAHGFDVVAPESLPVPAQIAMAAGADVLAGQSGTALHLAAFTPPGARILEIGDRRSHTVSFASQRVVDTVREHRTAFIPPHRSLDRIAADLTRLGLTRS